MAASLDRQAFFARARLNPFPGHLTDGQVRGIEAIFDTCPPDTPLDHLAYCLGTCPIETGWTMLPIREKGGAAYLTRMYDIQGARLAKARELGNLTPGDGARYCGRGYVQLTGRSNYRRATQRLRALGLVPLMTDLEAEPDFALDPDIAAAILFVGTREGWFTGKRLVDYFGPGRADWTGARRIINGQDRAAEIGMHARGFAIALTAAGYAPGGVAKTVPVPPVTTAPLPSPVPGSVFAPAPRKPAGPVASVSPAPASEKHTWGAWLAGKLSLPWS